MHSAIKTNNPKLTDTMQEIISQLTSKIGLSPEQAQGALTTVVNFLKEKLPAPLQGPLDSLLGGQGGQEGEGGGEGGGVSDLLEQAKGALGGFFK